MRATRRRRRRVGEDGARYFFHPFFSSSSFFFFSSSSSSFFLPQSIADGHFWQYRPVASGPHTGKPGGLIHLLDLCLSIAESCVLPLVHSGIPCVGKLKQTANHWGRDTRGVRRKRKQTKKEEEEEGSGGGDEAVVGGERQPTTSEW
ncbi:hypothetical protein B296_00046806 [Ensete ventricosum]|uniref:Uncharacterized protein n=1 Tax=Ensete ventricosum TaxID=4639 RepID=A0A426YDM7_ENSVE|nr:hypothetical protein B296_00046806 [Ensete ventricosum]